jgi:Mg-chelatase subunit ChlD
MTASKVLSFWRAKLRDFGPAQGGNIALTFAAFSVPLIMFTGWAIDYSRGNSAQTSMHAALDATGLALSKEAHLLSQEQLNDKADKYFRANFNRPDAKSIKIEPVYTALDDGKFQLQLHVRATIPTTIAAIWEEHMAIAADTRVVWGYKKLELALALDNTGSMSSKSKMTEMKKAAKNLIAILQDAAKSMKAGDVKISIVPFGTDVNIDRANVDASWIRWDEWEAEPAALVNSKPADWLDIGAGSDCPFTNSNPYRFRCLQGPNSSSTVSKIPSSGLICPSPHSDGTVYNGCYDSKNPILQEVDSGRNASCGGLSNCSCSGSGRNKVCSQKTGYPWVVNNHSTWNGCVWDRDQENDVNNTATNANDKSTLFSAHQTRTCPVAMMPLSYDWDKLNSKIDSMTPTGNTNVTIGMALAWQTLSPVAPYNAATPHVDIDKVVILLTDGQNTQNRWSSSTSTIDKRSEKACDNAKADGIKIYTIRVIEGNASLLRDCATSPTMYFDVQDASELDNVFTTIGNSLANLRLAQ